jgi:hypothetical protein
MCGAASAIAEGARALAVEIVHGYAFLLIFHRCCAFFLYFTSTIHLLIMRCDAMRCDVMRCDAMRCDNLSGSDAMR